MCLRRPVFTRQRMSLPPARPQLRGKLELIRPQTGLPRRQECETSFQSPPSTPAPAPAPARPPNLRPGRPPTPPGPPPPETERKKEHGEITFVFATRARTHTLIFPLGSPPCRGSPIQALA
ncbi:unnamed protein product [Rangifer tarandus platyrhynchus]|uniref:Uncharacterized protein n=1 Tax=Rangifer tarandus platyrhynchus TaxID=3082113 RepID=A0AC60A2S4_RANTA